MPLLYDQVNSHILRNLIMSNEAAVSVSFVDLISNVGGLVHLASLVDKVQPRAEQNQEFADPVPGLYRQETISQTRTIIYPRLLIERSCLLAP